MEKGIDIKTRESVNISLEDYQKLIEAYQKTQETDKPFLAVQGDDQLVISGNPDLTERSRKSYEIQFRLYGEDDQMWIEDSVNRPNVELIREDKIEGTRLIIKTYKYSNVIVNARKDYALSSALQKIQTCMQNFNDENGEVSDLEDIEILDRIVNEQPEIIDSIYSVVGAFLGISENALNLATFAPVLYAFALLMEDFPEIFRHYDVFFGLPTEKLV